MSCAVARTRCIGTTSVKCPMLEPAQFGGAGINANFRDQDAVVAGQRRNGRRNAGSVRCCGCAGSGKKRFLATDEPAQGGLNAPVA